MEGLWQSYIQHASWHHFSNSICSLHVCVIFWLFSQYFKFFLFPINDSSNLQNTYSAKFKLNKTFITLSIRDMVYANELPQNYKEDFTLTAVIELK